MSDPQVSARAIARTARSILDPSCSEPETRKRVEAWLAVQRRLAFAPEQARALLRETLDPRRLLAAVGCLVEVDAPAAARDREALARVGARLVPWPSSAYPPLLRPLPDAPPVLGLRGHPEALGGPAVAIVGARAATVAGLDTARALGSELARCGVVVVSGLARGIDAAAHRGALEAGGLTVAVQACGADLVYPAEHRGLARRIAERGAVVSELPAGTPPRAPYFPLRNRVISGLTLATVVIEARPRSGSLITARHALDQGREVLAVPGPLRAPTSEGPNRLLRDGARPVLDAGDVLDALPAAVRTSLQGAADEHVARPGTLGSAGPTDGPARRAPDARDRRLLEALEQGPDGRDGLARRLGWPVSEVAARLLALELDGHVMLERDGAFRRRG